MNLFTSVIITTYKRPFSTLSRAIESVLKQTNTDFELIIVDDNPPDERLRQEIEDNIRKLNDSRIRYIQHEENRGACAARNTGIENSIGEYIAFLDDDDEWLPRKLSLQLEKFKDEYVGLVYCDSYSIIINNNDVTKNIRQYRKRGWVYDKLIERNFVGSTSFVMLKKEALDRCGDFNINMKSAQDYELWLRISKEYKIDYVASPLVNYYVHEGERISTNPSNKIQGLEQIIKLNMDFLQQNRKIYGKRKSVIIPYYYQKYGYKYAVKKCIESFITYPFNKHLFRLMIKISMKKFKIN